MITAQTHLKESEPFIPYKALLIAISSVIYTLPLCLLYRCIGSLLRSKLHHF